MYDWHIPYIRFAHNIDCFIFSSERQAVSKKKWSRSEVEYLQSGREIHEALTSSRQPDIIEVIAFSTMC